MLDFLTAISGYQGGCLNRAASLKGVVFMMLLQV